MDLPPPLGMTLRDARPGDEPEIHRVISSCYARFDIPFDLDDAVEEHILAPHDWFPERGGRFFTLWRGAEGEVPERSATGEAERREGRLAATVAFYRLDRKGPPPAKAPTITDELTVDAGVFRGAVELKSLYVDPPLWRRGLGSWLIALVQRSAAGVGADRVVLWSDDALDPAHSLYERLGFRPIGRRHVVGTYDYWERGFAIDL